MKTTWKDVNGRSHVKQVTVEVQRGNDVVSAQENHNICITVALQHFKPHILILC